MLDRLRSHNRQYWEFISLELVILQERAIVLCFVPVRSPKQK
jgi:hypothetical protein